MARWVGIDEAGYGPNLGPLVMTAVVAEGPARPAFWDDLPGVDRAGGDPSRLWIDDSKRLMSGPKGLERLERATMAGLAATGLSQLGSARAILDHLGVESSEADEWRRWVEAGGEPRLPLLGGEWHSGMGEVLEGSAWRLVEARVVIVGPEAFNVGLTTARNKAEVHFRAFARLLAPVWERADDGVTPWVRGDKHGGRNFYLEPLAAAFPDAWIDRGAEGPSSSRYTMRRGARRLELELMPRADGEDGLVALASIISKYVRECWMADFNAFWGARVPGLKPTAGYPVDARRWRARIEPMAPSLGLPPGVWWRER